MLKRIYLALVTVLMLGLVTLPVAAAEETLGFNPPNWVGWLLAILALVLPLAVWAILRNRGTL